MSVVIVDYGSGNLRSAQKAFMRAARDIGSPSAIVVSSDPHRVMKADRIVVPGVGAFADCMRGLSATCGMLEALNEAVHARAVPLLGICVGMQLFATRGLEHEAHKGLGWVAGDVRRIVPNGAAVKIPHMGWNVLTRERDHPVLAGIPLGEDGWHAYFVHSYVLQPQDRATVIARAEHGEPFAAIVGEGPIIGTQFHPEKSQRLGLHLIANFLSWSP